MRKTSKLTWLVAGVAAAVVGVVGWLAAVGPAQAGVSSLSVGSATVAPGGSTTVSVTAVATSPGIGAYIIDVVYDNSLISATACSSNPAGVCNKAFAVDTVRFTGASASGLTGSVNIGSITFKAGTTEGTATLDLQVKQLNDPQGSGIGVTPTDGSITIETPATPTPPPDGPTPTPPPDGPTPTPPPDAATPTPTPDPAVAEEVQEPEALPETGGRPSGGDSSGFPWLAAIAGVLVVAGASGLWVARRLTGIR